MKYVMFEEKSGMVWPVLFPEMIDHSEINEAVTSVRNCKAISAGFVGTSGSPYGGSVSLKIKSSSEDKFYLNQLLNS